MTLDTEPRVETGRTWRDLPPSPPYGDPPAPIPVEGGITPPPLPPPAPRSSRWPWVIGGTAFLLALLLLLALSPWSGDDQEFPTSTTLPLPTTTTPNQPAPSDADPSLPPVDEPVADVAAALLPSVVQIESRGGVGSGFVYDELGLIFSAAHVVQSSNQVSVTLSDERRVEGTVIARDDARDVAVIEIEADNLVAAPLAVDEQVRVGQITVAIGSPFGFEQSVTSGIVSALDRSVTVGRQRVTGLIQTDASINQGNSGGPLANRDGEVIGINIAIASASGGSNGIGFAVPIATALEIAAGAEGAPPPPTSSTPDLLDDLFGPGSPLEDLPFDPFAPDSPLGDLFGDLNLDDPLSLMPDQLQDLLDELSRFQLENPLGELFGNDGASLVEPGTLPDGYQQTGLRVSSQNGLTEQVTTLSGPEGTVTIRATSGASAKSILDNAPGDVITVRGKLGRLDDTSNRITLVWLERDDLAVEVIAPAALGQAEVIAIADGLRVTA